MADRDDKRRKRVETFRAVASERLVTLQLAWMNYEGGEGEAELRSFLREMHTIKGEASIMGFPLIANVAHAVEDIVEPLKGGAEPGPDTGDLVLEGLDIMTTMIEDDPSAPSEEADELIARLRVAAGEVAPQPTQAAPVPEVPAPAPEPEPRQAKAEPQAKSGKSVDTVRVTADKLDRISDTIGELLLTRIRLAASARELRKLRDRTLELQEEGSGDELTQRIAVTIYETLGGIEARLRSHDHEMDRVITELETTSRELRLVAITALFEKYPRAVRSLAKDLSKKVRLRYTEEAVEVDRAVLKVVEEPLLHLVRNAVDHGIETPETRRRSGKSEEGSLILDARINGQMLEVTVSDDGAGIDIERVRNKAVKMGMVGQTEAGILNEEQVLQFLFRSGLSTATSVTNVSGRGIGLDVVMANVRSVGGNVHVASSQEPGRSGTTFTLSVPISVAITSVLLMDLGTERYAVPASSIVAVINTDDYPLVDSIHGPSIHYSGELLTIYNVGQALGEVKEDIEQLYKKGGRLILVRSGADMVALIGSENHQQRETVIKTAGDFLDKHPLIRGVVPLEDGTLALVIRVTDLAALAHGESVAGRTAVSTASTQAVPTVLVVDDSPVIRDLIAEALRSHGLRVIEASDGIDGLERLDANPDIDLIVSDIDMPRLDGIGMIKQVRARPGRRIPAVVVSMRGTDRDKKRAMEAGADSYLVKTDFSHRGLWEMLGRFLE